MTRESVYCRTVETKRCHNDIELSVSSAAQDEILLRVHWDFLSQVLVRETSICVTGWLHTYLSYSFATASLVVDSSGGTAKLDLNERMSFCVFTRR